MIAFTIQASKVVSNEAKDSKAEPPYGKKLNELFGQPNNFRTLTQQDVSNIKYI